MYNKLTRKELRIIEQTKREGAAREKEEQKSKWGTVRWLLWLVAFFFVVAFMARLIIAMFN